MHFCERCLTLLRLYKESFLILLPLLIVFSCVQAFGVGAMEEEDDDIYHKDAMSNYDVVLGGEEPGDGLYGWTAPQQYRQKKKGESESLISVHHGIRV